MGTESVKVDRVPRQVIEQKLLAALEESGTVAVLLSESDVCLLIEALMRTPLHHPNSMRARNFAEDLGQLRRMAFPK